MKKILSAIVLLYLIFTSSVIAERESTCYGTPDKGRLEYGWQLPKLGKNFQAYSTIGVLAGRNYVHSKVYDVVVDAYKILEKTAPRKIYIYGETGWAKGGTFRPHKTHQNGTSVDFFVPVLNSERVSVPLPTGPQNKFGYAIEFDSKGRYGNYSIDFEAMADHLLAIKQSANMHGIKIRRVIFDNELQKLLFKTSRGAELQTAFTFSKKKPWVRHDEHYHIDFIVPCKGFS